jgi:aryl-alcohol dehydrogenase-like predicted oxidoreductase
MVERTDALTLGSFTVHRLGFGTMQLTGPGVWGPPADRDGAIAVLRRAVDLGVQLIDTADAYGPDVAEELIRDALHPYPDGVRIATKAGMTRPGPGAWSVCGRPDHLRARCDESLARLGVERLDLFQLHRIDPAVPADEQFGVLAELRASGKVAEVGLSEVDVDQLDAARRVVPVASVQNQYNLAQRSADPVLDHCEAHGIAFLPWFPLADGRMARPGGPLAEVARELGATAPQVGLAWLLKRSPVMVPIPGTSSLAHLEENCAASQLVLTDAQYDRITSARRPLRRWALAG